MNNTKKANSIYHNKTGLILDKRKNSIINNKFITNYANKPSQYIHNDSLIKQKINAKKNNSVYFVKGFEKSKQSFIKSKENGNISNYNIDLNTSNNDLL